MEWDFYFDVARHCYDEVRHSKLGETRLSELGHAVTDFPNCVGNYAWRQLYDPLRRYCVLTCVIETDSFAYKHQTYQEYVTNGDMDSAEAVLYDITDETLHVRWGQKWTPKLMEAARYQGTNAERAYRGRGAGLCAHQAGPKCGGGPADRTDEELPTACGVLLEEPLDRRAALSVSRDALSEFS